MFEAVVLVANTLTILTGSVVPPKTLTNVMSSPPSVNTLIFPPVPMYKVQAYDGVVPSPPTYGMFTVSLGVTTAARCTCNF